MAQAALGTRVRATRSAMPGDGFGGVAMDVMSEGRW